MTPRYYWIMGILTAAVIVLTLLLVIATETIAHCENINGSVLQDESR